jgi:hypothetical protein
MCLHVISLSLTSLFSTHSSSLVVVVAAAVSRRALGAQFDRMDQSRPPPPPPADSLAAAGTAGGGLAGNGGGGVVSNSNSNSNSNRNGGSNSLMSSVVLPPHSRTLRSAAAFGAYSAYTGGALATSPVSVPSSTAAAATAASTIPARGTALLSSTTFASSAVPSTADIGLSAATLPPTVNPTTSSLSLAPAATTVPLSSGLHMVDPERRAVVDHWVSEECLQLSFPKLPHALYCMRALSVFSLSCSPSVHVLNSWEEKMIINTDQRASREKLILFASQHTFFVADDNDEYSPAV